MRRIITSVLFTALVAVPIGLTGPAGAGSDRPERIVSLSSTATEMLFAIGAGKQVVAVDDQSDFPKRAPTTDLSGYEPNVEAIAGYEPDLVVMDSDAIASQLEALGIEVLVLPAATVLDESYEQIEQLGEVTGHPKRASAVVEDMTSDIDELLATVPDEDPAPTAYYELDETFFSADSSTFIGKLLALAGFANIADEAAGDGSGYPQLSAEFIIESDPDVIFLADIECCKQSAKTVAKRPGFAELSAVEDDQIVELDDDVASRWGPRVVNLLRTLVRARNTV
jgi:iron complex transport system substrate-binding protein